MRASRHLLFSMVLLPCLAIAQSGTSSEMRDAGSDGETLGRTLLQGAPKAELEESSGMVTLPGQDRFHSSHIVGGQSSAEAVAEMKALEGADVDELDAVGRAQMATSGHATSDEGDAYRTLSTMQKDAGLRQDAGLWQTTFDVLAETMAPQNATQRQMGEAFPDCRPIVQIGEGDGWQDTHSVYEETTEVCERLIPREPVTRSREVEVANYSGPGPEYVSSMIVRDDYFSETFAIPAGALTASIVMSWTGSVLGVTETQAPTRENGWVGAYTIDYDEHACDAVPPDEPCAGRVQTVNVTFQMDYTAIEEELVCTEPDCLLDTDGWCTADWTCTDDAPRLINGITVDASFMPPLEPLYPGSSGMCWQAVANYDCHFAEGEICWDTPSGLRCVTQTQEQALASTCPRIDALTATGETTCSIQSSSCAEDGRGHGEFCYVSTDSYRCQTRREIQDIAVTTTNSCDSTVSCVGTECLPGVQQDLDEAQEVNVDEFGKQQAQSLLVHHILNDWTVPQGTTTPLWFHGTPRECKKQLGGLNDCCIEQVPGAEQLWFELYTESQRKAQAAAAYERASPDPGAASQLGSRAITPDLLNNALRSDRETINGEGNGDTGQGSSATNMAELMPTFLARARAELMLEDSWHCSDHEFDLAALRSVGACTFVGSRCPGIGCLDKRDVYCCFNSPVSKAARTVISGAAQGTLGTAKHPVCDGVTMEVVSETNWSGFATSDVVARLDDAGMLPKADRLLDQTDSDRLTGGGSTIVAEGDTRKNVQERTEISMGKFDPLRVEETFDSQLQQNQPKDIADPTAYGVFEFASAYSVVEAGRRVAARVRRQGSKGRVQVSWATQSGEQAIEGTHFEGASGVLIWEDGETDDKTLWVKTLPASGVPTDPLQAAEFLVVLTTPTGGAMLGETNAATIRLRPPYTGITVPTDPTQWVKARTTKRFLRAGIVSPVDPSRTAIEWEITMVNLGGYTIANPTLWDFNSPNPRHVVKWSNPERCDSYSDGGTGSIGAYCQIAGALGPGESISMRLTTTYPVGWDLSQVYTNTCASSANFYDDQWNFMGTFDVLQDDCRASGQYTAVDPDSFAGCDGVSTQLGGAELRLWTANNLDGFPDFMEHQPHRDIQEPWVVLASRFQVPTDMDEARTILLRFFGRNLPGVGTVRISQCPGDLRSPSGAIGGGESADCRRVMNPLLDGNVNTAYNMPLVFDADRAGEGCYLEPGQTYYLNSIPFEVSGPLPYGHASYACAPGATTCGVGWSWID